MTTPLSELDAEISTLQIMEGADRITYQCLWLKLNGQAHVIPFGPEARRDRVWFHVGGTTVKDLSLMPSFVSDGVHGFVRNGEWFPV